VVILGLGDSVTVNRSTHPAGSTGRVLQGQLLMHRRPVGVVEAIERLVGLNPSSRTTRTYDVST
jgi:hypothetical protein